MLIVNCGSMYSGKTTALMQQGDRYRIAGKRVTCFKPNIDTRYKDNNITNHMGHSMSAWNVNADKPIEILDFYHRAITEQEVCLIDEIQFFDPLIIQVIDALIDKGIIVAVAGLDMDFKKEPFYNTAMLMAKADQVNKHHAVCVNCGADAMYSKKLDDTNTDIIDVGGKDKYIAVCGGCYEKEV